MGELELLSFQTKEKDQWELCSSSRERERERERERAYCLRASFASRGPELVSVSRRLAEVSSVGAFRLSILPSLAVLVAVAAAARGVEEVDAGLLLGLAGSVFGGRVSMPLLLAGRVLADVARLAVAIVVVVVVVVVVRARRRGPAVYRLLGFGLPPPRGRAVLAGTS